MRYIIKRQAKYKIAMFYQNVIRKYRHTYSLELMDKNIDVPWDEPTRRVVMPLSFYL